MTKLNKRGFANNESGLNSRLRGSQACFAYEIITAVTNYDRKNPYGAHHGELGLWDTQEYYDVLYLLQV